MTPTPRTNPTDLASPETSHNGIATRRLPAGGSWRGVGALMLLFGALLGGAIGFNVAMDPSSEFGTAWVGPLGLDIAQEKVDRFAAAPAPATLILGSSRAFALPPAQADAMGLGPTFNFAVGSATPDAHLAIYRYVAAHGAPPQRLVVGLDVEQLKEGWDLYWQVRDSQHLGPHSVDPLTPVDWFEHAVGTVNPQYLEASARVAWYNLNGYPPVDMVIEPDGQVRSPAQEARIAAGAFDVNATVDAYAVDLRTQYERMTRLDPRQTAWTKQLVEEATAKGTQVTLLFTPLHPRGAEQLLDTPFPRFQAEAVAFVRSLCGPGVHVIDATDLASFGGDAEDFVDGKHYGTKNGALLLRHVFSAQNGDLCATPT